MNKNNLLSIAVIISLLLGSCKDNFDPQIYGQLFTSNFPKTEADYENYLMRCYDPFSVTWVNNWYVGGYGIHKIFDLTSDYCAPVLIKNWGGNWRTWDKADFSKEIYTGRNGNFGVGIREITRFTEIIGTIENADPSSLSESKRNAFVGEARLLRGLMMYYLFHMYGPIPVIIDPALVGDIDAEKKLVRPTFQEMSEWITADFEYAIDNMPNNSIPGRYNADYAKVCAMRHYLNEGSYMDGYYAKAISMYNELKGSSYFLFTSEGEYAYAEQFKMANKFNEEVIMAVTTGPSGDGSDANGNFNPLSMFFHPSDAAMFIDAENTIPSPFYPQGAGWGQTMNVSPEWYDTYDSDDNRRNVILDSYVNKNKILVTRDDIGVKWSGFIVNKYQVEIDNAFQPTDIPLARWADVLLMYAEAVARNTRDVPTGEALQGVNDVRARAGLGPLEDTAVASYEGFMDALLRERGHEMLYEGMRKIDLIRFNKYRHNTKLYKGTEPTHQYMPLPNWAVDQAREDGYELEQYIERPGWAQDN